MLQNRRMPSKMGTGGLILAGLAAYAYYKYTKMSDEQKRNMMGDIKEKGKKIYDDYVPQQVKDMINKKDSTGSNSQFGEGTAYTS